MEAQYATKYLAVILNFSTRGRLRREVSFFSEENDSTKGVGNRRFGEKS